MRASPCSAWADNDADAFVASYTEDATSILPSSASASRAATRDRMAAGFAGPRTGCQVRDEVQNVGQAEGGDGLVG